MPTKPAQPRRRSAPKKGVQQSQATPLAPPPLATREDPTADQVDAANAAAARVAEGLPEVPAGSSAPDDTPNSGAVTEEQVEEAVDTDDVRWLLGHLRGCPQARERSIDRVEVYGAPAPEKQGGGTVEVVRCQECGAHARAEELTENY